MERKFLYQKAKCRYFLQSDHNTKLFHSIIKRNVKKNTIPVLVKEDGHLIAGIVEVICEFLTYYQGLLGTAVEVTEIDLGMFFCGPSVSHDSMEELVRLPTDVEIKHALFGIGKDKSSGPDGYSSGFFKTSWDIVGVDVCNAVREFFTSGCLLRQLNHTIIALIPKSSNASREGDFRPIALCNVVYKIISKLLANRLETVLPGIIDEAQSAFISGRSMIENIHLAQELIKGYNRKRVSPRCLIKVDLRKAYDSVDWSFLRAVLGGLGFPPLFVAWIMECVTTVSYSIQINGDIHGLFPGRRGLRQGDPLSPYLFVMCLEYFSRLLRHVTRRVTFTFHPRCDALKVSHLTYADDLMLFSRGDIPSVQLLCDTHHFRGYFWTPHQCPQVTDLSGGG